MIRLERRRETEPGAGAVTLPFWRVVAKRSRRADVAALGKDHPCGGDPHDLRVGPLSRTSSGLFPAEAPREGRSSHLNPIGLNLGFGRVSWNTRGGGAIHHRRHRLGPRWRRVSIRRSVDHLSAEIRRRGARQGFLLGDDPRFLKTGSRPCENPRLAPSRLTVCRTGARGGPRRVFLRTPKGGLSPAPRNHRAIPDPPRPTPNPFRHRDGTGACGRRFIAVIAPTFSSTGTSPVQHPSRRPSRRARPAFRRGRTRTRLVIFYLGSGALAGSRALRGAGPRPAEFSIDFNVVTASPRSVWPSRRLLNRWAFFFAGL